MHRLAHACGFDLPRAADGSVHMSLTPHG